MARSGQNAEALSGIHVWLVLWKAYDACLAQAERSIENLGMCYSDFGVLECLLHKGPTAVNAIGEKLSLASGSITAAVDRLEKRGLVERQFSRSDRRARIVTLTAAGRRLIESAFEKHQDDMEAVAACLSAAERKTLLSLLKKLGKSAHASSAGV
jgi:MarR family 2-MHQ and catechol resistance regulon transcriptional repressor